MTVAAPILPPSTPVARVLEQLKGVKETRGRWIALCPAHDDTTPSLSIAAGADGRALVKCHRGCPTDAIVAKLGLTIGDLFPETPKSANGHTNGNGAHAPNPAAERPTLVKSYDYTDEHGTVLYQACRFRKPDGSKTFRQRKPDGNGGWDWSLREARLVPYRLPEMLEAIALGRPVYVVEGEKDADTLAESGYAATTNPMGAGKWPEAFGMFFRGAQVIVLPDHDEPGAKHAQDVAAKLTAAGASWVRVVELPGLPPKGDVTDWLEAGHTLDELDALIGTAPVWHPDPANRTRWRLDELLDNESIMRPPPAIVPRLAWAGRSTLLAAREKSGKSTLLGFIAAQVSLGGAFLGDPCARGPVLIVGLEEFIGDLARRLRHFRADGSRIHLVDRFRGDPKDRPRELATHLDEVDPALVIIDSLAAYSQGQIQDDNNATQMVAVVQPLTDLVHQRGCALILSHHARKQDGRARGSTAITAAADVVCEFFPPDEDADYALRRMRSAGRVPVPRVYDFRFDGDTYVLAGAGEAPLEQRVIDYVRSHPNCSTNAVAESVGGRKDTVQKVVSDLLIAGALHDYGESKGRRLLADASAGDFFRPGAAK